MASGSTGNSRSRVLHELAATGGRVAARGLRPFSRAVGAAADAGIGLERRVLESDELERVLLTALDSPNLQRAFGRVLGSDGMRKLVDSLFDSGLFDHILDRLLESDGLWRMIDVIAQSPAVTAAISQQGLGFADQVGDAMRGRSRQADDWLEQRARRIIRRQPRGPDAGPTLTGDE